MKAAVNFVSTPNYAETGSAQSAGQGVIVTDNRQEAGADLGGFVLKDRIWFFMAYDRARTNQARDPDLGAGRGRRLSDRLRREQVRRQADFQYRAGTSLVGSYFSDRETRTGALRVPQSVDPASYDGRVDTGGPDYGARLNQLFGAIRSSHAPIRPSRGALPDQAHWSKRAGHLRLHTSRLRGFGGRLLRRLRRCIRSVQQQLLNAELLCRLDDCLRGQPRDKRRR